MDAEAAILAKLDMLITMVRGVEQRVQRLETRFENMETRFQSLETRFENMETRFENMETRFQSLETRFQSLEDRFQGMDDRMRSLDGRFQSLDERMRVQGETLAEIKGRITDMPTARDFGRLEGGLAQLGSRIGDINARLPVPIGYAPPRSAA